MSNATLSIRAHFDGKYIVPDEPVALPLHAPLNVEVRRTDAVSSEIIEFMASEGDSKSVSQRIANFAAFSSRLEQRAASATPIAADVFRRENMYGDDGR
jgi:hypothetical protein